MNAIDLMARLNGEILNNKVRAVINGEIVIIARLNDQTWEYTEQGQLLANEHSNLVAAEVPTPKTRKKAAPAVESSDTPAETPVEEQAPAAE